MYFHLTWLSTILSGWWWCYPTPFEDGGAEELRISPPQRDGAIPVPLTSDEPKWRGNFSEGSDHPVTLNRLEF